MQVLRKILLHFLNITLLLSSVTPLYAQPSPDEYQIKAAFLFNFTQFVEWPAASFPAGGSPFIIGIVGKDPFGNYLNEIIKDENLHGHPLLIQHYKKVEDIKQCHILFFNLNDANKTKKVIAGLDKNILTVSDDKEFLQQGGMIRFYTSSDKIKLEINPDKIKEANLVISSKLLRLAKIFETGKSNN